MKTGVRTRRRVVTVFRTSVAVLATLTVLFPLYWMVQTAILPTGLVLSRNPSLVAIGQPVSLDAIVHVLTNTPMLRWMGNSFSVTLGASLGATIASTLGGYALSRMGTYGRTGVTYTLLLGRVLPGTLVVLPFFVLFRTIGLLDSLWAVILANVSTILPFATLLMKNYFDGVPRELDEAALVDGCSRLRALWSVLIPVALPGIVACVVFAATSSWVEMLFGRSLLLSEEKWTVPVGVASLIGEIGIDWNVLMAAGAISIVPVLLIYWFIQPYLVSGMTAGAVKG